MAKSILGIDIGTNRLKLAVLNNGHVKKTVSVPVPENLYREGRITSPDTMAGLLRETLDKNRIRVQDAAVVLSDDPLYLRVLNMPPMSEEQLTYNLPYEFNDYITGELKDYVFDYAVLSLPREEELTEYLKDQKKGKGKKKEKAEKDGKAETCTGLSARAGGRGTRTGHTGRQGLRRGSGTVSRRRARGHDFNHAGSHAQGGPAVSPRRAARVRLYGRHPLVRVRTRPETPRILLPGFGLSGYPDVHVSRRPPHGHPRP